jgi:hypothetical protein
MRRLQDPLVETADFVAEMNDSDAVDFDANMGTVCVCVVCVLQLANDSSSSFRSQSSSEMYNIRAI